MIYLEKKFISVSEYATIKGISKQAVYKQLNNKLKEFVVMVENKKLLNIAVLTAEELNQVEQLLNQPLNQVEQPADNHLLLLLEKQIEEKDNTIKSLLAQIESLQEQNGKLTDLLNNSQILLGMEKKQQLLEQDNQKPTRKSIFNLFKKK